jgi:hypothetical protein
LFVDEFQDVDPTQLKVFDRVIADKKFYIGDPDQAIYIFRGATTKVFADLEDFKKYNLDINYRSYQPILDFASCFKEQVKNEWWINKTTYHYINEMKADRGTGKEDCEIYVDRRGKFFDLILNGPTLMAKDLLKVVYNGETILTVEHPELKKSILEHVVSWSSEMTEVMLTAGDGSNRPAKRFKLLKREGMKMPALGLFLLFPKGTNIYIYLD